MMKKFLLKISYTLLPLWLIMVGLVSYVSLYICPNISGDIGNLALIPFGKEYDTFLEQSMLKDTLFKTIDKTDDLKNIHVDVLTIGDSFSQQSNGGYQNYLASKGLSVANCYRHLYSSPLQFAYNIMQGSFIDSSQVKVLVVESVERDFQGVVKEFDTEKTIIPKSHTNHRGNVNKNEWSLARTRDFFFYKMGMDNPIYSAKLDKKYFSSNYPQDLYFYYSDVENEMSIRKSNEEIVRKVFMTLSNKAEEKGIQLIMMIAVDKYDLYQNHIVNNPWPIKTVNEDIEKILGKRQDVLLAKKVLLPLVEKGEKDVFKFNDTHWSYKASASVANELYKRIITNHWCSLSQFY